MKNIFDIRDDKMDMKRYYQKYGILYIQNFFTNLKWKKIAQKTSQLKTHSDSRIISRKIACIPLDNNIAHLLYQSPRLKQLFFFLT